MTQSDLQRHSLTRGYRPRQFNELTRGRFVKSRCARHLARVEGYPTNAQYEMAMTMAVLEWGALQAEHEGSMRALREAREHRRLLLRVTADFERSLARAVAPPHATLDDHLARRREARG